MGENRFDKLTKELGTTKSRRGFMKTLAGGSLAAALAAVGIAAVDVEEADAASCRGSCRRRFSNGPRRRRCLKKCRKSSTTVPGIIINVGGTTIGGPCTSGADCRSGHCGSIVSGVGVCGSCPVTCAGSVGGQFFCCPASSTCSLVNNVVQCVL